MRGSRFNNRILLSFLINQGTGIALFFHNQNSCRHETTAHAAVDHGTCRYSLGRQCPIIREGRPVSISPDKPALPRPQQSVGNLRPHGGGCNLPGDQQSRPAKVPLLAPAACGIPLLPNSYARRAARLRGRPYLLRMLSAGSSPPLAPTVSGIRPVIRPHTEKSQRRREGRSPAFPCPFPNAPTILSEAQDELSEDSSAERYIPKFNIFCAILPRVLFGIRNFF